MMSRESENLGLAPYNFEPEFREKEIEELRSKMSECSNGGRDLQLEDWCFCHECEEMDTVGTFCRIGDDKKLFEHFPFSFVQYV